MGKYFEEFAVGDEFTTPSRTITEAHIVSFANLSGDFNPLHVDEEFAKKTMFGGRIAHGLLGLSIYTGLMHELGLVVGTVMAFMGLTWRFTAPIKAGDTITGKMKVKEKKEAKRADRGVIVFEGWVVNHRGERTSEGEMTLMMARKRA